MDGRRLFIIAISLMTAGACGSRLSVAVDAAADDGPRDGGARDRPVDNCLSPSAPATPWAISVPGTGRNWGQGIWVDCAGNSTIIGSFQGPIRLGSTKLVSVLDPGSPHMLTSDVFVARLDSAGRWLWATSAGGSSSDYGSAISVDSAGNSYVVGSYSGIAVFGSILLISKGSEGMFVAKLSRNRKWLWARSAGGPAPGTSISMDGAGNSHISGRFKDTASFGATTLTSKGAYDVFVAKLDSAGKWLWAVAAGGPSDEVGGNIAVDSAGNSHITGSFGDTANFGVTTLTREGTQAFVAKLDSSGTWLWARATSGTASAHAVGNSVSLNSAGDSFVAGAYSGTVSFGSTTLTSISEAAGGSSSKDVFVAKLDRAGKWLWAASAGGGRSDTGLAIRADGAGNSYVTGQCSTWDSPRGKVNPITLTYTAKFGSITLTHTAKPGSITLANDSLFVARLDSAGKWSWAHAATGGLQSGIALDRAGNSYVTGGFDNTASFGATTLTSQRFNDIFVWRVTKQSK